MKWDRGGIKSFAIADGADGSLVAAADLGRNYKVIALWCADAQYIQAATTLGAKVSWDGSHDPTTLYEQDGVQAWATGNLPTSGSFCFVLTHPFGIREIQPILSQVTSGGATTIYVMGMDAAV